MKKIVSATANQLDPATIDSKIESAVKVCLELNNAGLVDDDDYETIREILYRNHSDPYPEVDLSTY